MDFEQLYGRPAAVRAQAPGRVNLIGEHTDYQGGFVLPLAIPQVTTVELLPRLDGTVRVFSVNTAKEHQDPTPPSYRLGEERKENRWWDYVQGVTAALREGGIVISGFDALVRSEVPVGAGLSSSAALEVAVLRAIRQAFTLPLDDLQVALLAHKAETQFVGAPVGTMDQMASSLADATSALFLDTRSLVWEKVPLPAGVRLVVIDSGITHRHASGEYGQRRSQSEQAARALGVSQLRDLSPDDLPRVTALPEPLRRRARHIVTENARVLAFVEAMRAGDLSRLGQLLTSGHASLRDDYEVSVPEVDTLVDVAAATPGVIGARMTGGGFGGAVVILARTDAHPAAAIAEGYAARTGRKGTVLVA